MRARSPGGRRLSPRAAALAAAVLLLPAAAFPGPVEVPPIEAPVGGGVDAAPSAVPAVSLTPSLAAPAAP
ncbi:MAG: hypothetical protein KGM24_04260, partial [Elusimicrobia bacterium]|nr:hypothetical protein [Elusimicrobiota bacterium]